MTNNSLFTKVLVLVLCLMMAVGVLASCFSMPELNNGIGTTTVGGATTTTTTGGTTTKPESSTTTTTTTTTGDSANKDPVPDPIDPNQIYAGSTTLENDDLIYGSLANSILIGNTNEVAAIIPADVKVEMGASSLELSVKKVEDESFSDSLSSLDIHVSGVALDNTVPMTVMLGAVLPSGLANTELKLYHIEDGTPVLMTRVNSYNDFAIHNQYVYDAETGNVTIYVASFSVFSMVKSTPSKWTDETVADISWYDENATEFTLDNVAEFLGFRDLVDKGTTFEGKTVTLTTDIDLNNKLFNPIGGGWAYNGGNPFKGTFDGGNYTIYNIYVNGWELDATDAHTCTSKGAGLFSSIHNATIRNLTINGGEMVVETTSIGAVVGCAQGKCTFENITVSNVTIGNYQMRNGGIVGDIYVIESDNVTAEYSHTFRNILVDSTVKLCSMWGDFDTGNGGVIGGKYGSAKVLMENVTVAAELDVFSDVTAAYQWYAYRRCGMLVGYTGQNSPKQATNASADFLTCVNVNVYYGEWTNYTYYQFTNQDSSWQSNYPWVRAQASSYNGAFSNVRYGNPVVGGVAINTIELAEANKTDFAEIPFNQLYGGGQGVYGTAEHNGVITNSKSFKTIYINNNQSWENLKLQYWFANGDDTWTTTIDGIDMASMKTDSEGVYKIKLPAQAYGFKIVANGGNESDDFILADLEENQTYDVVTEKTPVAEVGGVQYTSLQEAINNANGGTVTLIDDIVLTEAITINNTNVTIDLAGKTIDAAFEGEKVEAILISGNSNVTIIGNGTVIASGKGDYMQALSAIDGAIVTIENGTFISHGCSTIYATTGAQITINGGHYEATEVYFADGRYYTLDIDETRTDENFGSIIVCGGEYVNFNPADHTTDGAQFANMLDKNHHSIKNGNVYTVAEHEYIPSVTEPTCTTEGYTTHTCSCGDSYVDNQVDALGHIYVNGICSCNDSIRNTVTIVFAEHNISNATKVDGLTLNNIDFDASKGTHTNSVPAYYDSDGTIRVYVGNTLTINAPEDTVIFEITFKALDGYAIDNAAFTSGEITTSDNITTLTKINAYSVTVTNESDAQFRILEMSITYYECAHNGGTTVQTVDPTCTESGYINTVCNSCNQIIDTITGAPATGHTPGEDATCTTAQTCTTCGEEIKPALEHTPGEEATCTTPQTCTACGEKLKPALGHTPGEEATCTTPQTCTTCETTLVEALGHTTENGVCDNCGETIGGSTTDPETPAEKSWIETELADIKETDVVVIVWTKSDGNTYAITNDNGTGSAPAAVKVTVSGNQLTGDIADNILWNIDYINGNLTIHPNGTTDTWLYCTSTNNGVRVGTNANKTFIIDSTSGYLKHTGTSRYLGIYNAQDVRCYTTSTTDNIKNQTLTFYVCTGSTSGDNTETPVCEHTNTTTNTVDATCVEAGSVTVTCDNCGETISAETIAATGNHTYEDGECTVCGKVEGPAALSNATLSFADKNNRTSFSTTAQVWSQNGVTLTNNKASSTNAVADYAAPVRFYAGSNIVVEGAGISKIVFDCNSSAYATTLKTSIGTVSGATVTVSSDKVTVTFDSPVESFTIAKLTAQVRMDSITIN